MCYFGNVGKENGFQQTDTKIKILCGVGERFRNFKILRAVFQ